MGFGHDVDLIAGQLSRILHGLRGPKVNTVPDLAPYFDKSLANLNPEPPPLTGVRQHESVAARLLHTTTLSWQSGYPILSPDYAKRHATEYRCNQTAYARWLRPDTRSRRNCLLYIHGWLEPGSWVEEAFVFPRWLRELDVDIVHVSLPFHGRRNTRGALFSGEFYWTADLVRSFEGIRQALWDARSLMGWLRRQGYERVGATGISLGGSLAMLLACLEPLPDYVIPIVCHTMLAEAVEHAAILWRTKSDLERFGVHEAERREIFRRVGFDTAMPLLPAERQLWVEAREDAHIDPALVRRQWEAWGKPNIHWIDGGHMTFPTHLPEITEAMRAFLTDDAARARLP
ncbi:MAG TPA: alpha/beta hydrolase family protein [Polyangiaceae bacterium]|jgi:pimeloyl-ACP methyl ester carboxylesterase|nr:alpha/beta hydrolase family protein [Polyangiaceae bacterium]